MTPHVTIRRVEVGQFIEARLRRQKRLTDDDPLNLTVIISEAVLRQEIGGPLILRGHLRHLAATLEEHPGIIDIFVVPFTATVCSLFRAATCRLVDSGSPAFRP